MNFGPEPVCPNGCDGPYGVRCSVCNTDNRVPVLKLTFTPAMNDAGTQRLGWLVEEAQ